MQPCYQFFPVATSGIAADISMPVKLLTGHVEPSIIIKIFIFVHQKFYISGSKPGNQKTILAYAPGAITESVLYLQFTMFFLLFLLTELYSFQFEHLHLSNRQTHLENANFFCGKGLTIHGIAEKADGAQPSFPGHRRRLSHCRGRLEERSGAYVHCNGGLLADRKHQKIKHKAFFFNLVYRQSVTIEVNPGCESLSSSVRLR